MKPKDIFGLAVRLLGLFFLYYGLKAVTQMLDIEIIENADKYDIINGVMPIIFNLAIAWWLIGGGLVRRAYPEPSRIPETARSRDSAAVPQTPQPSSQVLTGMEQAEQKLAALVEKPGHNPGG